MVSEDNIKYAQKMIDMWHTDRGFVIDIADTADGFKIVECNTLNMSGFYKADVSKLIQSIEKMNF